MSENEEEFQTEGRSGHDLVRSLLKDNRRIRASMRDLNRNWELQLSRLRSQMEASRLAAAQKTAEWDAERMLYLDQIHALEAKVTTNSMSFHLAQARADESQQMLKAKKKEASQLVVEREAVLEGLDELEESNDALETLRRELEAGYEDTASRLVELESEKADVESELEGLRTRYQTLVGVSANLEGELEAQRLRLESAEKELEEWRVKAELASAEDVRLKQQLQAQYEAVATARNEAEKAKAEAFESRQKMLNAINEAEAKEMQAVGLRKAEQRAQQKEQEVEQLKASLALSQRNYEALEQELKTLGTVPSGGSITEFMGRLKKLRRTSSDD